MHINCLAWIHEKRDQQIQRGQLSRDRTDLFQAKTCQNVIVYVGKRA